MHYWGDTDFDWDGLYKAEREISTGLRKARIGVHTKEKYGTIRYEFLTFWDGSIWKLLFPNHCFIQPAWRFFHFKIDRYIVEPIMKYIGILKLFNKYQTFIYRKTFEKVIRKLKKLLGMLRNI